MKCEACGAGIEEGLKLCPYCGAPVIEKKAKAENPITSKKEEAKPASLEKKEEAVVLTEDQKRALLREEIRMEHRGEYDSKSGERIDGKNKKGEDAIDRKTRKIGSLVATIVSFIFTVITYIFIFRIIGGGDLGEIIVYGFFFLLPMELIAIICAFVAFIMNLIFLSTGRFSWMVLINFLISIGLIGAGVYAFLFGINML